MRLHRFHGGLVLAPHSVESTASPIRSCPVPEELVLPLRQHPGAGAEPCVAVGSTVMQGERIAQADGVGAAHLHAPAPARVVEIASRPAAQPGFAPEPCIVLRTLGQGEPKRLECLDPEHASAEALLDRVREAGIVGLGGAAFPTHEKLAAPRHTLILNGAECEPWIACDDALLRERADQVVRGGRLLRRATHASRVLLALEDSMVEAGVAVEAAIAAQGAGQIELVRVPTRYPQGGERQLIETLTGLEVPSGGLPRDIGVVVQNVATAAACWRAAANGETLTSRVVCVTGPGVARPGNFEVAFGTPIAHLIEAAGGYTAHAARLMIGGPLMGLSLPHDDFPVTKATNCVLVLDAGALRDPASTMPCIRCGECSRICPARLMPQDLHAALRNDDLPTAAGIGLMDCIECGACDLVCPSHIPLAQEFRWGRRAWRLREQERQAADAAGARHAARRLRLERIESERAARRRASASGDAVQAALARARREAGGDDT